MILSTVRILVLCTVPEFLCLRIGKGSLELSAGFAPFKALTPAQKFYWSCRREDKAQSEDKFLNFLKFFEK